MVRPVVLLQPDLRRSQVVHTDGPSVGYVLRNLVRHPVRYFVRRWNWKSAVLSSLVRSALFFLANIGAGFDAARSAFLTELVFRSTTAGFYGALTQAFRDVRPVWTGTVAGMILLPVTGLREPALGAAVAPPAGASGALAWSRFDCDSDRNGTNALLVPMRP